jgi:protease-4
MAITTTISELFTPIKAILSFIQKYFKALIFLLILYFLFSSTASDPLKRPNLAKIYLKGPIFESEVLLEKLQDAQDNGAIKGVLFVVDSPGGSVPPSIEIALAVKRLKESKPVIAYASGTMASGSYYASIYANKIVANPGSMIGSIGVIMSGYNIEEIAKKIGFKPQVAKIGKYKEMGTMYREWNDDEKAEINTLIKDTYDQFVQDVATARDLDANRSSEFADAHVFSSMRAKKVGLIDQVGSIYDATNELKKLTNVKKVIWQEEDKFDKFLDKVAQKSSSMIFSLFSGLKAY